MGRMVLSQTKGIYNMGRIERNIQHGKDCSITNERDITTWEGLFYHKRKGYTTWEGLFYDKRKGYTT